MTALLSQWANSLDLSREVSNPDIDFSSGFLFAELLQKFDQDVNIAKISDSKKISSKIKNFVALAPTFKSLGIKVGKTRVRDIVSEKAQASSRLLFELKTVFDPPGGPKQRQKPGRNTGKRPRAIKWKGAAARPSQEEDYEAKLGTLSRTERMLQTNLTKFSEHKFEQDRRNKQLDDQDRRMRDQRMAEFRQSRIDLHRQKLRSRQEQANLHKKQLKTNKKNRDRNEGTELEFELGFARRREMLNERERRNHDKEMRTGIEQFETQLKRLGLATTDAVDEGSLVSSELKHSAFLTQMEDQIEAQKEDLQMEVDQYKRKLKIKRRTDLEAQKEKDRRVRKQNVEQKQAQAKNAAKREEEELLLRLRQERDAEREDGRRQWERDAQKELERKAKARAAKQAVADMDKAVEDTNAANRDKFTQLRDQKHKDEVEPMRQQLAAEKAEKKSIRRRGIEKFVRDELVSCGLVELVWQTLAIKEENHGEELGRDQKDELYARFVANSQFGMNLATLEGEPYDDDEVVHSVVDADAVDYERATAGTEWAMGAGRSEASLPTETFAVIEELSRSYPKTPEELTKTPENGLIRAPIAVCVLGAPLAGKSHFCRALRARRNLVLLSPEAVLQEAQEYADAEALLLEAKKAAEKASKKAGKKGDKKGGKKGDKASTPTPEPEPEELTPRKQMLADLAEKLGDKKCVRDAVMNLPVVAHFITMQIQELVDHPPPNYGGYVLDGFPRTLEQGVILEFNLGIMTQQFRTAVVPAEPAADDDAVEQEEETRPMELEEVVEKVKESYVVKHEKKVVEKKKKKGKGAAEEPEELPPVVIPPLPVREPRMDTDMELSPFIIRLTRSKQFLEAEDAGTYMQNPATGEVYIPPEREEGAEEADADEETGPGEEYIPYPLSFRNQMYEKDIQQDLQQWLGALPTFPETKAETEYNAAIALAKEREQPCDATPLDMENDADRCTNYSVLELNVESKPELTELELLQLRLDLNQAINQFRRFGRFQKGASARIQLRSCTIRHHWTGRLTELRALSEELSTSEKRIAVDRTRALALALHELRVLRGQAASEIDRMMREFRQALFTPVWSVDEAAASYDLIRRDYENFNEPFEELREDFWERVQDQQNRYEGRLHEAQVQDEGEYHAERRDLLAQIFASLAGAETDSFRIRFMALQRHFMEVESACLSPRLADMGDKELKVLQSKLSQKGPIAADHPVVLEVQSECNQLIKEANESILTAPELGSVLVRNTLNSQVAMAAALQLRLAIRFNLLSQEEVSAQFSMAFSGMDDMVGVYVRNENQRLNQMVDDMYRVIKFRGVEDTLKRALGPQPSLPFSGEVLWAFGKSLQSRYSSGTMATTAFEEELKRSWLPGKISATVARRVVDAMCPRQSPTFDWREFIHAAAISGGYVPQLPSLEELLETRRAMHAATRGKVPDRLTWDMFSAVSFWFDDPDIPEDPNAVTGDELRRFYFELWSDDGGESVDYPQLLLHWCAAPDPQGGPGVVAGHQSSLGRAVGLHRAMLLLGYPIAAKYIPPKIQTSATQLDAILKRHRLRGLPADLSGLTYSAPDKISSTADRDSLTEDGTTFDLCCAVDGAEDWISTPTYVLPNIFKLVCE